MQLSVSISDGFGRPSKTLEPHNLDRIGLGYLVLGTALLLASSGSKTSCVITMSRLSDTKLTVALWSIAASTNVLQTTNIVMLWVGCTPPEKAWNPAVGGSCWPWEFNLGVAKASAGACLVCVQKFPTRLAENVADEDAPYQHILELSIWAWP